MAEKLSEYQTAVNLPKPNSRKN